jgi:hypothetical protein
MFDVLTAAVRVANAVPVQVQGLSWGGVANWAVFAVITPLVVAFFKIWPKIKEANNARDKNDNERDASMRADMLKMLEARDHRISELEKAHVEEQRRCIADMAKLDLKYSTEMSEMQKRHDAVVAELQGEIKGMRRTLLQRADSGEAIGLHSNAPTSVDKFLRGEDK